MRKRLIKMIYDDAFSLIEILVVISIIMVGILGISSLSMQTLQVQDYNKNALIASMLAQEGMEMIRNKRDTNWLEMTSTGGNWARGQGANTQSDIIQDFVYTIDFTGAIDNSINAISDAGARLYKNGNFYSHNGAGTPTIFYRAIIIDPSWVDGSATTTITSLVQWNERGSNRTYNVSNVLYDWR